MGWFLLEVVGWITLGLISVAAILIVIAAYLVLRKGIGN